MRALFSFACDLEGDFGTNPAQSKAARPKVDRNGRTLRALDVAEAETFLARMNNEAPHIAVPMMLSAYLGTRRGETVGLRVPNGQIGPTWRLFGDFYDNRPGLLTPDLRCLWCPQGNSKPNLSISDSAYSIR